MYLKTPIKWLIDLDSKGNFQGFVTQTGEGRQRVDRGKEILAPHAARTSGIKAKLLADTGEYVLGISRKGIGQQRVRNCHRKFIDLVKKCADHTKEPTVEAVLSFLENLNISQLQLPQDFDASFNITFRVEGVLPIHIETVQKFWATEHLGEDGDVEGAMECIVCGETRPPVKRHQFKIKGIPGGQMAGMALISANEDAFLSYGLKESLIAPTCPVCVERYAKAANDLLSRDKATNIRIDPLVYIFWTKEEKEFSPASLFTDPDPAEVRALIESAFKAERSAADIDPTPFYACALSASGGRVAVRDWLDSTVGEVKCNLGRYFALQSLINWDGIEGRPLRLYELAYSTVRDRKAQLPPNVPRGLIRKALKGGPLPDWLLFQAIKRNRVDKRSPRNPLAPIPRSRAALIKMVLLSQKTDLQKEDAMVQLNPKEQNPAYLCGRLLRVLESVQHAAIPGAGATIIDRFYGTASSAPASVFGRLLRTSQAHLGKLRKERPGTYEALERKLEEVMVGLPVLPLTLNLEEQGLFALGYYHQRADDRAGAIAYKEKHKEEPAEEESAEEVQ